ncbi:hypothetical protein ACOMHN_022530 [Nucella lapillus]
MRRPRQPRPAKPRHVDGARKARVGVAEAALPAVPVYMYMAWRLHHAIDRNLQEHNNPPLVPKAAADRRECQLEPRGEEGIAVLP